MDSQPCGVFLLFFPPVHVCGLCVFVCVCSVCVCLFVRCVCLFGVFVCSVCVFVCSVCVRRAVERRSLLERMDAVLLVMDEIIDGG